MGDGLFRCTAAFLVTANADEFFFHSVNSGEGKSSEVLHIMDRDTGTFPVKSYSFTGFQTKMV